VRFSNFSKWFLYKSMITSYCLLFCNMIFRYSGQILYEDAYWALYDVTCTTVGISIYGIFETDMTFRLTGKEQNLGFKLAAFYKHCKQNIIE
jgi:magnesium-transporting ATPase (P-type)